MSENWNKNSTGVLRRFEVENVVGIFVPGRRDQLYIESSHLYISEKTVHIYRVADLYLSTVSVHLKKQHCGPSKKLSDHEDLLILDAIFDHPGIHLDELQANVKHVFGMDVSLSTICSTVKKMGLTRQRLKHVVLHRSEEERVKFIVQVQEVLASHFAWLDKTWSDHRDMA